MREITNIEMDLRFEAAAANELYENTKLDKGFNVPKIYWNYTTKKILTLDKVNGVSIREQEKLEERGINLKYLAENLIQHFLKQAVRDGFSTVTCIKVIYLWTRMAILFLLISE